MQATLPETSRQVLADVQRYLADEIAPLLAVDAARALVRMPAKVGAGLIQQWVEAQLQAPDRAVTVSSYLYHAVKKIQLFAELELVDAAAMEPYLRDVSRLVLELCPERERLELRGKLSRIGEVETALSAPVKLLNREKGTAEEEAALEEERKADANADAEAEARRPGPQPAPRKLGASRRVSMFLHRLGELLRKPRLENEEVPPESQEVLAQVVAQAALEAASPAQLEASLRGLKLVGVEPRFDRKMFGLLGERLPGWEVEAPERGHVAQAMHRIVSLAATREEGIERFGEMVYAAIDQLNDGHLAQAVAMLDVAERLVEEKKVEATLADLARSRAESSVSLAPLRQFASVPTKHGLLRKVLRFFPAFRSEALLARLDGEPKRDTRKLLLSLVEVHGPPSRPALLTRLEGYRSGQLPDPDGFYSRNIVFLLRRIPRNSEEGPERELELLAWFSNSEMPFMVAKEAVGAIALVSGPRAEQLLAQRLADFERAALSPRPPYAEAEVMEILDRICAALARLGTRDAMRHIAHHAFRSEPQLGVPLARIRHLASCDLGRDPDQLEKLVAAVRNALPRKVLGIVLGRAEEAAHLITALGGTSESYVQGLLEEIAQRFPSQPLAQAAREALARLHAKPQAENPSVPGTLSGDVELFGLPTLFQSLADTDATGSLVIAEANASERGSVRFVKGRISHCTVGTLEGLDAICQLFERPRPGTFRFERAAQSGAVHHPGQALEVLPTVLEAIRRHDEFQEDRALVPDGVSLMPTGTAPSLHPDEEDARFVRAVWREAMRGTAPESCEGPAGGDAFRVRRLYAHWLEKGALTRRPAA